MYIFSAVIIISVYAISINIVIGIMVFRMIAYSSVIHVINIMIINSVMLVLLSLLLLFLSVALLLLSLTLLLLLLLFLSLTLLLLLWILLIRCCYCRFFCCCCWGRRRFVIVLAVIVDSVLVSHMVISFSFNIYTTRERERQRGHSKREI